MQQLLVYFKYRSRFRGGLLYNMHKERGLYQYKGMRFHVFGTFGCVLGRGPFINNLLNGYLKVFSRL